MKIEIKEDPRLPESARILEDIITDLEQQLITTTKKSERETKQKRIKKLKRELQVLNSIRRRFILRKLRGETTC